MATPPRVTRSELVGTIQRIVQRHERADAPHRELLPDPAQADPREVLDYLDRYGGGLPRAVRRADVLDAATLEVWLWWEDRRRQLARLRRGVELKVPLLQLGAQWGIRTAQGVRDLMHRREALLRYDRPDEKLAREARRVTAGSSGAAGDARQAWVRRHGEDLSRVAERLLREARRYGVEGEWLEELSYDSEAGWSPASLSVLGLAAGELRTAHQVVELESARTVHRALREVEALRERFAGLA